MRKIPRNRSLNFDNSSFLLDAARRSNYKSPKSDPVPQVSPSPPPAAEQNGTPEQCTVIFPKVDADGFNLHHSSNLAEDSLISKAEKSRQAKRQQAPDDFKNAFVAFGKMLDKMWQDHGLKICIAIIVIVFIITSVVAYFS